MASRRDQEHCIIQSSPKLAKLLRTALASETAAKQLEAEAEADFNNEMERLAETQPADRTTLHSQALEDIFVQRMYPVLYPLLESLLKTEKASLREALKNLNVKPRLKGRIKLPPSILNALPRRRGSNNSFRNFDEVLFAVHDLVGLRVVLMDPKDILQTDQVIQNKYYQVKPPNDLDPHRKVFPGPGPGTATMGAYSCRNYRLTLRESSGNPDLEGIPFEVQRTTCVEDQTNNTFWHDFYKNLYGTPDANVMNILDNANSMIKFFYSSLRQLHQLKQEAQKTITDTHEFHRILKMTLQSSSLGERTAALFESKHGNPSIWLANLFMVFGGAEMRTRYKIAQFVRSIEWNTEFSSCNSMVELGDMMMAKILRDRGEILHIKDNTSDPEATRYLAWKIATACCHLCSWGDKKTLIDLKDLFPSGKAFRPLFKLLLEGGSNQKKGVKRLEKARVCVEKWYNLIDNDIIDKRAPKFRRALTMAELGIAAIPNLDDHVIENFQLTPVTWPVALYTLDSRTYTNAKRSDLDKFLVLPLSGLLRLETVQPKADCDIARWESYQLERGHLETFLQDPKMASAPLSTTRSVCCWFRQLFSIGPTTRRCPCTPRHALGSPCS